MSETSRDEYRLVGVRNGTRCTGLWREGQPSDEDTYSAIHDFRHWTEVAWELRVVVTSKIRTVPIVRPTDEQIARFRRGLELADHVIVHKDDAEVEKLRALLTGFVAHETEPCALDHHGNCLEHDWFIDIDGEHCGVHLAREALGIPPGERVGPSAQNGGSDADA